MKTQVGTLLPTLFALVAKSRPEDNKMQDWESTGWFLARTRVRRVTRRQARDEVDRSSGVILGDSLSSKSTACLSARRCVWRGTCARHTCLVCRYSRCSFISVFSAGFLTHSALILSSEYLVNLINSILQLYRTHCLTLAITFGNWIFLYPRRDSQDELTLVNLLDHTAVFPLPFLYFFLAKLTLSTSQFVCETPGELNCVLVSAFYRPLWRNYHDITKKTASLDLYSLVTKWSMMSTSINHCASDRCKSVKTTKLSLV